MTGQTGASQPAGPVDYSVFTFGYGTMVKVSIIGNQGGITCEAIDEPGKSSKAIDKRVIINFRNKNVVIARFRDKNEVFVLFIIYIYIYINKYSIYLYIHVHF